MRDQRFESIQPGKWPLDAELLLYRILPRASLSDRLDFYNRGRTQPRQKETRIYRAYLEALFSAQDRANPQRLLGVICTWVTGLSMTPKKGSSSGRGKVIASQAAGSLFDFP